MPFTGGTAGREPRAAMTASGAISRMSSGVTSVFRRTSMGARGDLQDLAPDIGRQLLLEGDGLLAVENAAQLSLFSQRIT
jgi:hypothetical protein